MKQLILMVSVGMLTAGCEQAQNPDRGIPPEAFLHLADRAKAHLLGWGIPAPYPCGGYERSDQCYRFSEPRRFRGLWRADFEGSRFCPAPARECSYQTPGEDIWLDFTFSLPPQFKGRTGRLYTIEFVGRRSLYAGKGAFGHVGMSDREIIADRLISIGKVQEASVQR